VIAIDVQHFPLVLLDMGRSRRTPEDLRGMFDAFREANARTASDGRRWVLVAVTEEVPSAVERKTIIEESNKFSAKERECSAGSVLVISNAIVRAAVTALTWMIPNLSFMAAPTTDVAVQLAVERLRALHIDHPEDLAGRAAQWFRRSESSSSLRRAANWDR
jgi:hypothetical protein